MRLSNDAIVCIEAEIGRYIDFSHKLVQVDALAPILRVLANLEPWLPNIAQNAIGLRVHQF